MPIPMASVAGRPKLFLLSLLNRKWKTRCFLLIHGGDTTESWDLHAFCWTG